VSHAYQVLVNGGMEPSRIVVMMADDIAHHLLNPYPGQVFNCPGCPDVYSGTSIDYRGPDVNASNVLAVLGGHTDAMRGIGSGRVIASGPQDRVFVYYTDHGSAGTKNIRSPCCQQFASCVASNELLSSILAGLVGMPYGQPLFADDLVATLKHKHKSGGFYELVVFLEACHSGSMFRGLLDDRMRVFATTAANATEMSWATYCPGANRACTLCSTSRLTVCKQLSALLVPRQSCTLCKSTLTAVCTASVWPTKRTAHHATDTIPACLGDLYSVAWIELAEDVNLQHLSLEKEYKRVAERTSMHGTYFHVRCSPYHVRMLCMDSYVLR
jgi:legumain